MSRVKSQEPIGERIAAHVEVTKFARDLDRSPSLGFYWLLSLYVKSRAQNRLKSGLTVIFRVVTKRYVLM